jgi:hypothetical protein
MSGRTRFHGRKLPAKLFNNGIASEVLVPVSQYDGGRDVELICDLLIRDSVPAESRTKIQIDLCLHPWRVAVCEFDASFFRKRH